MIIVVASSPTKDASEVKHVIDMFENGLETFHLRKPKFSKKDMIAYLEMIPARHRNKIVIHTYHGLAKKYGLKGIHLGKRHRKNTPKRRFKRFVTKMKAPNLIRTRSCNQLADLVHECHGYDYALLSPVFDGISKNQHGAFSARSIRAIMPKSKCEVYAMGGVTPANIKEAEAMGFHGAVLMGSIWKSEARPIDVYLSTVEALNGDQPKLESA